MTDVKQKGEKVSFEMKPDAAVDVEKIPAILEEYKRELSFQAARIQRCTGSVKDKESESS